MDFKLYYQNKIRQDLTQFFSRIPDSSRFHEDPSKKVTYSIQVDRLSPESKHLDFLTNNSKIKFSVALYFTVLVDMVFYEDFEEHYPKFQGLTLYPKFIGSCPGGCGNHLDPRNIFAALNDNSHENPTRERLDFSGVFSEARPIMKDETLNFFKDHL